MAHSFELKHARTELCRTEVVKHGGQDLIFSGTILKPCKKVLFIFLLTDSIIVFTLSI